MQVELLAPAGNFDKLKTALHFGADAVYVGGKQFSLRTYADNFTDAELQEAVEYVHTRGKKIYVTVNIFARNADFEYLRRYFVFLYSIGVDAVIISDPGVIACCKEVAPDLTVHVSTQANLTNAYAVRFWQTQGAKRAILARELSLREISEIHAAVPTMELECFIQGAMCISYSGRCLLSNYLAGRESNRGACVQACRWQYEIRKKGASDDEWMPLDEDGRGTYILNSKDLCLIDHLPEMAESGVCSFKIEGRMKSEYYLATVIHAYRQAIDFYKTHGRDEPLPCEYRAELSDAAHRAYTTAYALGGNEETVNYTDSQAKGDCDYVANVLGYDGGILTVEMRNRFKSGETLEVLSPDYPYGTAFTVRDVTDEGDNAVSDAKLVQATYRMPCPFPLRKGDILRRRK